MGKLCLMRLGLTEEFLRTFSCPLSKKNWHGQALFDETRTYRRVSTDYFYGKLAWASFV